MSTCFLSRGDYLDLAVQDISSLHDLFCEESRFVLQCTLGQSKTFTALPVQGLENVDRNNANFLKFIDYLACIHDPLAGEGKLVWVNYLPKLCCSG